jgi:polyisoprenyl-phosphate glycosyltransferase
MYGLEIVYETLVYGAKVPGYPSLFVGVMVLGGVQLIMIGVVGEYIGKILEEIKGRPVYFVAEHDVKPAQETQSSMQSKDMQSDAQSGARAAAPGARTAAE